MSISGREASADHPGSSCKQTELEPRMSTLKTNAQTHSCSLVFIRGFSFQFLVFGFLKIQKWNRECTRINANKKRQISGREASASHSVLLFITVHLRSSPVSTNFF
jgi:hypothetical protein